MKFSITKKSYNKKTGPIPVVYSDKKTCPPTCPFKGNGCYADNFHVKRQWDKVSLSLDDLCDQLKTIPGNVLTRYGVAGDLPGEGIKICPDSVTKLIDAAQHLRMFGYTHKPLTEDNQKQLRRLSEAGLQFNVSCNSLSHLNAVVGRYGANFDYVVIVPSNTKGDIETSKGIKVKLCPAIDNDYVTCANCGICQQKGRDFAVGFTPHGSRKKLVDAIASGCNK